MSPAPSSQQGPNSSPRQSSIVKLNLNPSKLSEIQSVPPNPSPVTGGATSDGEATGGEMSDGGKRSKIKLRLVGTPTGSRAGSPGIRKAGPVGSRASSPSAQVQGNCNLFETYLNSSANCFGSRISHRKIAVARHRTYPASRNHCRAAQRRYLDQ